MVEIDPFLLATASLCLLTSLSFIPQHFSLSNIYLANIARLGFGHGVVSIFSCTELPIFWQADCKRNEIPPSTATKCNPIKILVGRLLNDIYSNFVFLNCFAFDLLKVGIKHRILLSSISPMCRMNCDPIDSCGHHRIPHFVKRSVLIVSCNFYCAILRMLIAFQMFKTDCCSNKTKSGQHVTFDLQTGCKWDNDEQNDWTNLKSFYPREHVNSRQNWWNSRLNADHISKG